MILHADSHTNHVSKDVLEYVLFKCGDKKGFFTQPVELPDDIDPVQCSLYGPAMGDGPILESEVYYQCRPGRDYPSRLVHLYPRRTFYVTVIGGPYQEYDCVLYTVYGGPQAPKEVNDPNLKDEEREVSRIFWSQHALAGE